MFFFFFFPSTLSRGKIVLGSWVHFELLHVAVNRQQWILKTTVLKRQMEFKYLVIIILKRWNFTLLLLI